MQGGLPLPTFKKPFHETCEEAGNYWHNDAIEDGWMPPRARRNL